MANDTTVYTTYPEAHTDERGRYFDGQFLTSQDFVDEQRYHVDRLRRALDHLTVSGVADGLDVTPGGAYKIKLAAGAAFDARGRQLVQLAAREADVPKDIPGGIVDVAIYYAEVESRVRGGTSDEDGTRGASRMRELPALEFYAQNASPKFPDGVPLARLRVAGDGTITVDNPNPVRRATGLRFPSSGANVPTLRAGWARANLLTLTGDLHIAGRLGINTDNPEAELDVRGTMRFGHLSQRVQGLKVEGDEAKFYPIVFRDIDWWNGPCTLEIVRAEATVDDANAGALLATIRWHAVHGHGNELMTIEVEQTRRFIAHARPLKSDRLLIVWLRGKRNYSWRANQKVELVDGAAAEKTLHGEKLEVRATIDPAFDRDRFRIGPALERDTITADLAYTGKLDHLDTLEANSATVRAYDLYFGHSTRRGTPGRALVDNKEVLVINFNADWSFTRINSMAHVTGDLTVDGATKLAKTLSVTGGVNGNLKLNDGALTVFKGGSFGDNLKVTREAEQLTLARAKTTTGGTKMFFELIQEDGSSVPDVYPAIRFHHQAKWWQRLEARSDGLHVKTGDLANDGYRNLTAQDICANGALSTNGGLTVRKNSNFTDNVRITRESEHLTVHRAPSETTGGGKIFLELVQEDVKDKLVPEVGVSLRFHHAHRYWHRIEGAADGLHVRDGAPNSTDYHGFHAGDIKSNSLHVVTGKSERLRIVRGVVNDAGKTVRGSGFSVSQADDLWLITFDESFAEPPTFVVTQQYPDNNVLADAGSTLDNAIVVRIESGKVWIKTGDKYGNAKWRRFHFIAIGL